MTETNSETRTLYTCSQACTNIHTYLCTYIQTQACHHSHRLNEPPAKGGVWNGCPDWHTAMHSLRLQRLLWLCCPGHAGVSGNERADRLASTADITSGLQLGRAEVLRGLRDFLNMDRPEHHSIDCLKERGMEKGSGRHSTLQGRERSVFNQANIGTVSRATLGRLLRDWVEHVWAFPSTTISKLYDELKLKLELDRRIDCLMYFIFIHISIFAQNLVVSLCKEKAEWLEATPDPTTQDFISQRVVLEENVSPVMQKLAEPRK